MLLNNSRIEKEYSVISESDMFDAEWFKNTYELDESIDPILFFIKFGVDLGLNPSSDFDTNWYLEEYNDVAKSGINPFVHYIKYGIKEGRFPKAFEFNKKYLKDYAVIRKSNLFDEEWYIEKYLGVNAVDPIIHYLEYGVKLNLNPSPDFNTENYLKKYPNLKVEGINPFVHYLKTEFKL